MGRKRAEGNERLGEYIQRRSGGMLELRFPLPVDVREAFLTDRGKPRTHIITSLGTTDVKLANAKADPLRARIRSDISQVRLTRKSISLNDYLRRLYDEELEQFHIQAADDALSAVLRPNETIQGIRRSTRKFHAEALVSTDPNERRTVAGWAADRYLQLQGRSIDSAPDYQEIVDQCANAIARALATQHELAAGRSAPQQQLSNRQKNASPEASNATGVRGSYPILQYFKEVQLPFILDQGKIKGQNTISGKDLAIELFSDLVGNLPVGAITKAHLWKFHDDLLKFPNCQKIKGTHRLLSAREKFEASKRGEICVSTLNPKTVNKHLSGVKSLLTFAEKRQDIGSSPGHGVHAEVDRSEETGRSFTTDELNRIFSQPLFTGCQDPSIRNGWRKPGTVRLSDDRFWIPLVLLFTGARPSEVAGLETTEVVIDHEVPHFVLIPTDVRGLKNPKSKRIVPIHSYLLDLGFKKFAKDTKRQTDGRFFPMAEQEFFKERGTKIIRKKGLSSSKVMEALNEKLLADADARDNRGSNKCYRNTFEQEALAVIPSDEHRRRLTGRDVNSSVQIYTQNIPDDPIKLTRQLKMLQVEIEKIAYEGVTLPTKP